MLVTSIEVDQTVASAIADLPSRESQRSYAYDWRCYMEWLATRELDVTAVRPKHVQLYIGSLRDRRAKASIGRALSVIRTIYGRLVCDEHMTVNPAREVKAPRVDNAPKTPWIREEAAIEKLLNVNEFGESWTEKRDRLIIRMALGLGWRRSEVARVTVEDLDGDAVTVRVKGGLRKTFGLPDFCAEEIFEWRMFAGIDAGPLFPRNEEDGRAINGGIVYRIVRQSCARVGITVVPPHALRRTAVSYLREHGVGLKPCQLMLGHAQEATTGRYDKARDARANRPGEAFGKLVHA